MDIDDINDLIRIRSYFAENDESMFSHWAYKVLGEQIEKLNRDLLCYTASLDTKRINELIKELKVEFLKINNNINGNNKMQ